MNDLDPNIPPDVAQSVANEIDVDEKVLYATQPVPGRMARNAIPLVLFGIPWTAFSVFWICAAGYGAYSTGGKIPGPFAYFSLCFPMFGLPFVLIGIGMLTSPFWAMRSAKRTVYVVTSRRAIIFTSSAWRSSINVRSFEPQALSDLRRTQNSDGSGDLVFTQDIGTTSKGNRTSTSVGFMAVAEVKEAERRVRDLVEKSRG